ncbi:cytochrome b [Ancylobacter sp. WKF20]|uniref:cytochrome b n=1 Tax=Ancylobacter sp. WKF20 TaxID=3039801 RepID=UPI00243432D5|nr:cytochrome b [Ancylobacter sp. WKF20]WGD29045.1 cytochrome b [Ancylobacter sp. WKF20]
MPIAATYDRVARLLHWTVAVLILVQFATGWSWGFFERGTDSRFYLFRLHLFSGYAVLGLVVLRIVWRLTHPAPPLPTGMPRWQHILAHATHGVLYLAILIQPILGAVTTTAFGKGLGIGRIHVALAYGIAALVVVHIGAALWHHFVRRDGLILRMLPARR